MRGLGDFQQQLLKMSDEILERKTLSEMPRMRPMRKAGFESATF
jgi:hypothetical protein